ncbi:zinc knuckle CX2CX4HX4C containing protein [Tanacetum coccineum]
MFYRSTCKNELKGKETSKRNYYSPGNKSSKKSGLAAKVTNIKGKLLGKDEKPLRSCLKTVRSKTIQGNPVGEVCSHSVDSVTKATSNTNSMKPTHAIPLTETVVTIDDSATRNPNPNVKLWSGSDGSTKQGAAEGHPKSKKFTNTLYGYFIGERLAFPIVEAYVKNAWAKYGFECAIFRNGFFFFKFSSHDGMVKTLDGGPWFIGSMPIFLNFTTQLGRPIMLDACTRDMCLNPYGRNSYARVLVELSSECDVLESIVVAIPLPKGEGHYLETLDVEYEWVKKTCSDLLSRESGLCDAGIQHKKKEVVNGADIEPNVSQRVTMNDSLCSTNENGYFKDDIDLGQLGVILRSLWMKTRYREYDLAHLKLVFEFSIYKDWKSVRYGVSKDWIRRIEDFLEYGYAVSSLMDMVYWSSE